MYKYNVVYVAISLRNYQMYIGVKSFNKVSTFKKYKTSSTDKYFRQSPKMKIILSSFSTREETIELEVQLHQLLDIGNNKSFANKVKQTSRKFDNTGLYKGTKNRFLGLKNYWINKELDIKEHCYMFELVEKYNLNKNGLGQLKLGKSKTHKGWSLNTDYPEQLLFPNKSIRLKDLTYGYSKEVKEIMSRTHKGVNNSRLGVRNYWINVNTQTKEHLYLFEMCNKYNLNRNSLSYAKRNPGKVHKGWKLDPDFPNQTISNR